MEKWKRNTVHTVDITGYTAEGAGVARLEDGMIVFVPGALAGETCLIRLQKVNRNAAWGKPEEVLTPSPARIAPDCPWFGRCGGCQLRHMTYEEELRFKRARVHDALSRIGGLELRTESIHGAADILRYRNKVQFPIARVASGRFCVGFYRARSHEVIPVKDCLLQPEEAALLRRALLKWMARWGVSAYDEKRHSGLLRHLFLRFAQTGVLCCLVINGEPGRRLPQEEDLVYSLRAAVPALTGIMVSYNSERTNVVLGRESRVIWGQDWLDETLCGLTFRLSAPSFFQVNRAQTEVLYDLVEEYAGLTGTETVLDLYCGTGTISLVMARHAGRVLGVEIVPQAVEDAEENARRNGMDNAQFWCGDADSAAKRLLDENLRPDVVTVDPPRKGLAPEVIQTIAQMSPRRVVYVSCDPATLARDLKRFRESGYEPERAAAVDLFPRTHHVECVALLSRAE